MHLKHLAARLTAAVLLVSTLVTPASALTGTVKTDGGSLRLRSEASTSSTVLKQLANGATVEVLSDMQNGWYQVSASGVTGYVSGEYILIAEEKSYVRVVEGPLNIRSGPGTEYDKVGTLAVDKVVEVLDLSGGWYQIGSGYISADYVTEATAEEAQKAVAETKSYVKVISGPLNIRSGPSTEYDKVGSLPAGKVVEVKGLTGGWYQISSGYISAEYVAESTAEEAQNSGKGQDIANYALQFLGSRYVYGGSSPKGFDCSGFTSYVYKQCGHPINRTASTQLDNGRSVSKSELKPGDLVFFKESGRSGSRASHVGIYIGSNQFIHASNPTKGVIITSMDVSYYRNSYIGARRIVE